MKPKLIYYIGSVSHFFAITDADTILDFQSKEFIGPPKYSTKQFICTENNDGPNLIERPESITDETWIQMCYDIINN